MPRRCGCEAGVAGLPTSLKAPGAAPAPAPPAARRRWHGAAWWPWVRRLATTAFFVLVAFLLLRQARGIAWGEVWSSMQARSEETLLLAVLLAAASHLLYSSFDLFGRRLTRHPLRVTRVMATTFVSYVYNLNLGTLIGGMAFRYRLYWRQGLQTPTVTTVLVTSMLTNWIGYLALGGLLLLIAQPPLPEAWGVEGSVLHVVGAAMLVLVVTWWLLCTFAPRRIWTVRGRRVELPGAGMAALQIGMSALNWSLMATVVWVLLGADLAWSLVLGALLLAAVAGVMAHVPAGLGVFETVFVALLVPALPTGEVLAAVLLYRAVYYLLPLLPAIGLHWHLERRGLAGREGRLAAPG